MSKKVQRIIWIVLALWLLVLSVFVYKASRPLTGEDGITVVNNYIDGFSSDLSEAYDEVKEKVVFIRTDTSSASGFIARSDEKKAYIVTSYHAIENSSYIKIELDNFVSYDGELVGYDEILDVAVLAIDNEYELSAIEWGDDTLLKGGNFVLAIGNPKSEDYRDSIALGLVSSARRSILVKIDSQNYYLDMIQSDIDLSEGYSGGPLINMSGELVGLNTMVVNDEANIALSLGSSELRYIVEEILHDNEVSRINLGIRAYPMRELTNAQKTSLGFELDEVSGIYVDDVLSSSIAEEMGIKTHDVILSYGKIGLDTYDDFLEFIYTNESRFELTILRDGERIKLSYPL